MNEDNNEDTDNEDTYNEIYDEENINMEDDITEDNIIENDSVKTEYDNNPEEIDNNAETTNVNIDKNNISVINYLIADDCKITRKFHKHILNLCKYSNINFIEAINGTEVIKLILMNDINYFNAIFIDNTMPKLTGCNTTLILRLLNYNKIIIAITGDNNINIINTFIKMEQIMY